ncbi:MAG: hypothetical protein Q4P66_04760 [Actinomycetaceae bacterium]|nr:hypothetical protein [Actinomycetaceae bacterium]
MRAPYTEQLKLLELQPLDTELAKLNHKKKTLPEVTTLAQTNERAQKLQRLNVQATTHAADMTRELKSIDTDAQQVNDRLELQSKRLHEGKGSARELVALQGEVKRLQLRSAELEEQQMAMMEKIEAAQSTVNKVHAAQQATSKKIEELQERLHTACTSIDADIAALRSRRETLASTIDAALLAEYEAVRERTGGTGVIGLRGPVCPELGYELSPAQWDELIKSDPDEVIFSDEFDYILIHLDNS